MKVCSKCKIEKPFSEFHKDKSKRDGLVYRCKSCSAEYCAKNSKQIAARGKIWRENNKEESRKRQEEWRLRNPEKSKENDRRWRKENPEKSREYVKRWRDNNPDKVAQFAINWRSKNLEKVAKSSREWRAKNPEKKSEMDRLARARRKGAEGSHTAADVRKIFESQRGICANCPARLIKSGKNRFHVDHIQPLSKGGSNWPDNLQCLCPACNLRKSNKDPFDWAKENWKLL